MKSCSCPPERAFRVWTQPDLGSWRQRFWARVWRSLTAPSSTSSCPPRALSSPVGRSGRCRGEGCGGLRPTETTGGSKGEACFRLSRRGRHELGLKKFWDAADWRKRGVATCNGLCNRCRWLDYIGPVSNGLGNQLPSGFGVVEALLKRDYVAVANPRNISKGNPSRRPRILHWLMETCPPGGVPRTC